MNVVCAGFLLVKADGVPSASDCICPQFPGVYAIAWSSTPDAERKEGFAKIGIAPERRAEATEWATAAYDDGLMTLEEAQRFCELADVDGAGHEPGPWYPILLVEYAPE